MRKFIKPWPKQGETRRRKKFLLLPQTIGNLTRWLEVAEWEEEYDAGGYGGGEGWFATRWLDISPDDGGLDHD